MSVASNQNIASSQGQGTTKQSVVNEQAGILKSYRELMEHFANDLSANESAKYIVAPSLLGGVGSIALSLRKERFFTEVRIANNPSYDVRHDLITGIAAPLFLELPIMLASNILLGAITGFVGTVLTIGVPSESNRSRVVASALMFSLFFPSLLSTMEQNTIAKIRAEAAEEQVQRSRQRLEEAEEIATDVLGSLRRNFDDFSTALSNGNDLDIRAALVEVQKGIINDAKSLVTSSTSVETAKRNIDEIVKAAEASNNNQMVVTAAVNALREIQGNTDLHTDIRQYAKKAADQLLAADAQS